MRKILLHFSVVFLLFAAALPMKADASGGYCVIKGEKVYHSVFCSETWGCKIEDMKWYKTIKEVERTGNKPCEYCADAMFDYEEDGSTRWFSKDDKIQNALEMERFMGVMDSLDAIEDERDSAYQEGYSAGTSDGKEDGYKEGYGVGYADGVSSEKPTLISILFTIGIPCVVAYWIGRLFSNNELGAANIRLKRENDDLKKLLNQNRISNN